MSGAPKSVGEVLDQSARLSKGLSLNWYVWKDVVGLRLAQRTRPMSLHDGTLTVKVSSSIWAQELSFLQDTLLHRLNARGLATRRLRFRVGQVDSPPRLPRVRANQPSPIPAELAKRLAKVEDPEVRRAIAKAASYAINRDSS